MRIEATRKDVAWGYLGTLFSMASNFILLPFLVWGLSGDALGLWYVFLAINGFVTLFEFGFGPTFARNIAFCWSGARSLSREGARNDLDDDVNVPLFANLLAVCRRVYLRVTLAVLVVLALPGSAYILYVSRALPLGTTVVSWVLFCCATLLNMYFLYFGALLRGVGKIAAENKIKVASRVTQIVVSACLLGMGMGLVGACLGYMACSVVYRLLCHRTFWGDREIERLGVSEVRPAPEEVRRLYRTVSYNARRDGFVQVANYASTQASTLISSLFLSLSETGAYSIGLQFATAIGNIALSYLTSQRPTMQSAFQRREMARLRRILGKSLVAYLVLSVLGTVAVVAVVYPLMLVLHMGESFDPAVFLYVELYMFAFNNTALFSNVLANMNVIPYMKSYVVAAVLSVALSALLAGPLHWGVWGLVTGMLLAQGCFNVWYWPRYTLRKVGVTARGVFEAGLRGWKAEA